MNLKNNLHTASKGTKRGRGDKKKLFWLVFLIKFVFLFQAFPAYSAADAEPSATGGSPELREYHLKAAFLRYVAKFVKFPAQALKGDVFNICVLGLLPSFDAIETINGKIVDDRSLAVTKLTDVSEAKGNCQILFISKTEEENIKKIVEAVANLPILTFGDMENFAQEGGCMNFYILNNRLAIMINPTTVEKAQLKIDPRMLKLVTVVPPV